MGEEVAGVVPEHTFALTKCIFNEGFNTQMVAKSCPVYTGLYEPDTSGPNPMRKWIYFKVIDFEHCTKEDFCFGYIARGVNFELFTDAEGNKKTRPINLTDRSKCTRPYVAIIIPGQDSPAGRPVDVLGHDGTLLQDPMLTVALQAEWQRIFDEFNARFTVADFNSQFPVDTTTLR
ncbi:hypothetical protein BDP27DRAFT_1433274 [Rhodocollybia butyracea]|uniref:Uncharacterized protein n=1 Tax=Rhodocollybia butyracea TaxID=206335 RepID=A0A9P5TWA8_9AGAR|nr:hypothetical protein BDP27DRAFT_1433274 [Rhodocollybia butyracea]